MSCQVSLLLSRPQRRAKEQNSEPYKIMEPCVSHTYSQSHMRLSRLSRAVGFTAKLQIESLCVCKNWHDRACRAFAPLKGHFTAKLPSRSHPMCVSVYSIDAMDFFPSQYFSAIFAINFSGGPSPELGHAPFISCVCARVFLNWLPPSQPWLFLPLLPHK